MKKSPKGICLNLISVLLFIMGILFIFTFKNGICFGDNILNYLGLKPWSNGTQGFHYTIFYSLVFFIPSFIIKHKSKNNITEN